MTLTPVRIMTFEEYLALPESEDLRHAEFVDGEVVVNRPHALHLVMQGNLYVALREAAPEGFTALFEWDWVTRAGARVRGPDLLVLRRELVEGARLVEPPLLALEVLSPDSVIRDLVDKRDEYADAGLEHYLVARPYDTPALWHFRRDGDVLREQAYVLGATPLTLPEPFRPGVPLVPAELVRP
ncbi:MAG: Uma2 family endonuclease [Actinomycetota bacterium]|nr:Uma2 family endonuclease [Actinomycetota bacterium]